MSLAERLAAAQAAVAGPRQRVSELEAALAASLERSDYGEAAALQVLLVPEREALALAEVDVRLIGEAQAALEEERRAEQRAVQEAQQRDQARQAMEQSAAAEKSAQADIDSALGEMWDLIRAAQDAYLRAQAAEGVTRQARHAERQARMVLEPLPPGHNYPVLPGENRATALASNDPLIRELSQWRP